MVAPDDDRCRDFAVLHHFVEPQSREVTLFVAEPTNPCGETFEVNFVTGFRDPALEVLIVREQFDDGLVRCGDVGRVTGERDPSERPFSLCEQRTNVRGNKTGKVERAVITAEFSFAADRIAVVKND